MSSARRSSLPRNITTARLTRQHARRAGYKVHDLGTYERTLAKAVEDGYARRVNGSPVVYEVQTDGCLCRVCRRVDRGHRRR